MRAPLSLTLCLLSLLATAQEVENPVWATNWPDPTIWQAENGMYYCLATNPRRMLHSTDLFHWAIDERSPYNAHHTRNMVRIAEAFLDDLKRRGDAHAFDDRQRRGDHDPCKKRRSPGTPRGRRVHGYIDSEYKDPVPADVPPFADPDHSGGGGGSQRNRIKLFCQQL